MSASTARTVEELVQELRRQTSVQQDAKDAARQEIAAARAQDSKVDAEIASMRAEIERLRAALATATAGGDDLTRSSTAVENNKCPICFDVMVDACTLSCGHSGCLGCMQTTLLRGQNRCPTCRAEHQGDLHVSVALSDNIERLYRSNKEARAEEVTVARLGHAETLLGFGQMSEAVAAFRRAKMTANEAQHADIDAKIAAVAAEQKKPTPLVRGARVEYHSSSYGQWLRARVERVNSDGTVDLDVRPRADPSRIRRLNAEDVSEDEEEEEEDSESEDSDEEEQDSGTRGLARADAVFLRDYVSFRRIRQLSSPEEAAVERPRFPGGSIENERRYAMRGIIRQLEQSGWEIRSTVEKLWELGPDAPHDQLISRYIDRHSRHLLERMLGETYGDTAPGRGEESPAAERESAPAQAVPGARQCPTGHGLLTFAPTSSHTCDVCGESGPAFRTGQPLAMWHGCRACNWDMCEGCHASLPTAASSRRDIEEAAEGDSGDNELDITRPVQRELQQQDEASTTSGGSPDSNAANGTPAATNSEQLARLNDESAYADTGRAQPNPQSRWAKYTCVAVPGQAYYYHSDERIPTLKPPEEGWRREQHEAENVFRRYLEHAGKTDRGELNPESRWVKFTCETLPGQAYFYHHDAKIPTLKSPEEGWRREKNEEEHEFREYFELASKFDRGELNKQSRWVKFTCASVPEQAYYYHSDAKIPTLTPPEEGWRREQSEEEEEFRKYLERADKMDRGELNPHSRWMKLTCEAVPEQVCYYNQDLRCATLEPPDEGWRKEKEEEDPHLFLRLVAKAQRLAPEMQPVCLDQYQSSAASTTSGGSPDSNAANDTPAATNSEQLATFYYRSSAAKLRDMQGFQDFLSTQLFFNKGGAEATFNDMGVPGIGGVGRQKLVEGNDNFEGGITNAAQLVGYFLRLNGDADAMRVLLVDKCGCHGPSVDRQGTAGTLGALQAKCQGFIAAEADERSALAEAAVDTTKVMAAFQSKQMSWQDDFDSNPVPGLDKVGREKLKEADGVENAAQLVGLYMTFNGDDDYFTEHLVECGLRKQDIEKDNGILQAIKEKLAPFCLESM